MWKNYKHWITFILIAIVAILVWRSTFYIISFFNDTYFPGSKPNNPTYGELGDMFGVVNAIFSGLAFAGIIITILLQKAELTEQRKELSETRKEFQINRFTNIIFKQVERIDNTVKNLQFKYIDGDIFQGILGIYKLNQLYSELDSESLQNQFHFNSILKSMNNNYSSVLELSSVVEDSSKVIERIINNSDLTDKVKNKLVFVYKNNIGKEVLNYIDNMYKIIEFHTSFDKNRSITVDTKIIEIVTDAKKQINKVGEL